MKICITSSGASEDSQTSPMFGRCPYFAIFDQDSEEFTVVENKAWQAPRGAGVAAAQKVSDLGCQAVITGNVGPNAFYTLNTAGIKVFSVFGKTAKEALSDYKKGKLKEVSVPTGRLGFGRGRRWQ